MKHTIIGGNRSQHLEYNSGYAINADKIYISNLLGMIEGITDYDDAIKKVFNNVK